MTGELANLRALKVLAWPIVQQYKGRFTSFHDVGSALGVSKLLVLVILASRRSIGKCLLDRSENRRKDCACSTTSHRQSIHLAEQDTLARKIASDLARGQR